MVITMNNELLNAIKTLLQEELQPIKSQLTENTQIIRSLVHASETQKADADVLMHKTVSIEGNLQGIAEKIDAGFVSVNQKLDTLAKDINVVEAVTGKNMQDIAYLKAVK